MKNAVLWIPGPMGVLGSGNHGYGKDHMTERKGHLSETCWYIVLLKSKDESCWYIDFVKVER